MRTARYHAGEALEDGNNIPGIVLCALGILALALTLVAAAYGFMGWMVVAVAAAVVCGSVGVTWVLLAHKRVKNREGLALRDQMGH
ncbi:hypothetical protein AB0C34_23215 [Nocardia sp. NPDC049220]|uniref:hypothetical protein n=1 Tax=Nocardia sp. NPDC049220 TaxID=3155273 RepID=UPI003410A760